MKYIRCTLEIEPLQPATDIFIAALADLGFESFEETPKGLKAYILEDQWDEKAFRELPYFKSDLWEARSQWEVVEPENWNAVWERDYTPISVKGQCVVRAPFHDPPSGEVSYDIVISPKMSFGTGHHQTTHLMLDYLLDLEVADREVLDVGTGTGVLAILCGMRGARAITAIDIDPWSFENAMENAARNLQTNMEILQGSMEKVAGRKYDLVLANINRNALLDLMGSLSDAADKGGTLLISGFYKNDLSVLRGAFESQGFIFRSFREADLWTAAFFVKG